GFDALPAFGEGVVIPITPALTLDESMMVDVSGLDPGEHQLYIQLQDESGNWSFSQPQSFIICDDLLNLPVVADLNICAGEAVTYSFDGQGAAYRWYDADQNFLSETTSASINLGSIESTTVYNVSQVSPQGCETQLVPFVINVPDEVEIYAGPDETTFSYLESFQLDKEFPKGGVWSGSSFVDENGLFRTSDAGIGDFTLTYAVDSAGCTYTDEMVLSVTRFDNDAPVLADQVFEVFENPELNAEIGLIASDDSEGDELRFFGKTTNDTLLVRIDSLTGSITVKDSTFFDFETNESLVIAVQVKDPFSTTEAEITFTILDENEAPIAEDQTFTIAENSTANTPIGTVSASDPESDVLSYAISDGNDLGGFAIDDNAGELSILDSAVFDFETNPSFTLTIAISDGLLTTEATVTVNLTDVAENTAPTLSDQLFTVEENSEVGTVIGNVVAEDPEDDVLTFSIISGNDENGFALDPSIGSLTVATSEVLDFETTPTFSLEVEVSDGEFVASAVVTIDLLDVDENESPTISPQTFTLAENSINGTEVGTVIAADPDEDALTYTILSGNDAGGFALDNTSGLLTVATSEVLDFETTPTFNIEVEVSDGELTASATITIDLTDVDETQNQAPQINAQTFTIAENSINGTEVGTVIAADPDEDALTYTIL
ncbi:MAG: cadherin repeat domain-containing protein, partial [Ekhidna sp.]|nr:cadherin repeat domain-containing protein [Ekhidna sp.]